MQYYDQHLHTYFSPDSTEAFEAYLNLSKLPVITTEHLDFYRSNQPQDDVILDYKGYSQKIQQLNNDYEGRLLKGIEVGFTYPDRKKIKDYMKDKLFDLVLLSVHHNGRHGFMHLNHDTRDIAEHLDEYFHIMLQAVQHIPEANVLAHFDFGLRGYDNVTVDHLLPYEEVLIKILRTIILHDQALELNTRSMYRYGNAHLYDYIIPLYQDLGGKLFTVSSDAHVSADYEFRFADAFSTLEQHGVDKLVVFQKGEPKFVNIPSYSSMNS